MKNMKKLTLLGLAVSLCSSAMTLASVAQAATTKALAFGEDLADMFGSGLSVGDSRHAKAKKRHGLVEAAARAGSNFLAMMTGGAAAKSADSTLAKIDSGGDASSGLAGFGKETVDGKNSFGVTGYLRLGTVIAKTKAAMDTVRANVNSLFASTGGTVPLATN